VRVRQLHAAQEVEPVPATAAALQRRPPGAPAGRVPHVPLRRRPRREPPDAAAGRGVDDVADAERAAPAVAVALVPRPRPEVAPRPGGGVPHHALHHAGLVQEHPRHGRPVAVAEHVRDLAVAVAGGVVRELELEHVLEGGHLRDAAEPHAVPRARPVRLAAVAPDVQLRRATRVHDVAEVAGRRVVGAAPRPEGPVGAGPHVLPDPHLREERVGRVLEALPPRHARRVRHHQVARVAELRADDGRRGGVGVGVGVGAGGRPDGGAVSRRAVEEDQSSAVVEPEHAGRAVQRAVAVGDPDDGVRRDGEPYAKKPLGVVAGGEEAQLEGVARRHQHLLAGDGRGLRQRVPAGGGGAERQRGEKSKEEHVAHGRGHGHARERERGTTLRSVL